MCRKIKKVGNQQRNHIFYDVANSLLPTILLIISIIQILLRRAWAPELLVQDVIVLNNPGSAFMNPGFGLSSFRATP